VIVEGFGEARVDAGLAASGLCQSVAEFVDLLGRSEQDPPVLSVIPREHVASPVLNKTETGIFCSAATAS
jgi:hypothetical protein